MTVKLQGPMQEKLKIAGEFKYLNNLVDRKEGTIGFHEREL